jgi:hypothetical protein
MQLVEVNTPKREKDFIKVNVLLNSNNENYIRPLDKDVLEVFDPEKNKAFRHGECNRWLLLDGEGKLAGRIAAFVNKKYRNKGDDVAIGGVGFFDCINNQQAADMLFDVAKHWLMQRGMQAMDGPINFGERDRWWGLVVQGFQQPLYCMNYNPPYYQALFETYGFQKFFDQVCFGMNPKVPINKKQLLRHHEVAKDPAFVAKHLDKLQLEKFAKDFCVVYNKAWAGHGGLKEMKNEQAIILFKKMKPVINETIVWMVYHNQTPVATFLNLPDLNQWFKYLNGKFGILQKLQFLWVKATTKNKKFTGLVFGVVPEYQGKGVDAFMIGEAHKIIMTDAVPYTEYEMQWIGDFNPKMINVAESLGDVFRTRTLTTYRYLFNRQKEFKRHPLV